MKQDNRNIGLNKCKSIQKQICLRLVFLVINDRPNLDQINCHGTTYDRRLSCLNHVTHIKG